MIGDGIGRTTFPIFHEAKGSTMKWKTAAIIALFVLAFEAGALYAVLETIAKRDREAWETEVRESKESLQATLKNYVDMAYTVMDTNHQNMTSFEFLEWGYGERLRNVIDLVESYLREKTAAVRDGRLGEEQAREQARAMIRSLRYGGGTGYVWINDTGRPYPRMIMHPTVPELEGEILDDPRFDCARGRDQNLFQAFVEVCLEKGEGFVDYLWPKPTPSGLIPKVPKLSFVRLFKPWNWIVGTGIYLDDAADLELEKTRTEIRKLRYNDGEGYFWINDDTFPVPRMIMHPFLPELEGKIVDDPKYNCPLGQGRFLFEEFVSVCRERGSGFVEYFWPKPTSSGMIKHTPKISYVRRYAPLGWIVGSGFYLDSFDRTMRDERAVREKRNRRMTDRIRAVFAVMACLSLAAVFGIAFLRSETRR